MTKILVTGASGQLGKELVRTLSLGGFKVTGLGREQLDISNLARLNDYLDINLFDLILNASAFTDLDAAELGNPRNFEVNAMAPAHLAIAAIRQNAKLIHFSTDAVFASDVPNYFYSESEYSPLNAYGRAKVRGEINILGLAPERVTIIRTSWLFGAFGGKFFKNVLSSASEKKSIQVVDDQFGQPTNTKDLADFVLTLIKNGAPTGIFHFASPSYVSRLEFARKIYEMSGLDSKLVEKASTNTSESLAPRAKYSLLYVDEHLSKFRINAPNWERALLGYFAL